MKAILEAIDNAETVLICGHVRPDGRLPWVCFRIAANIASGWGRPRTYASPSPIPESYKFLRDSDKFCKLTRRHYDLFIAVDCATHDRIGRLDGYFRSADRTVCIDHHEGHSGFADINLVRSNASSTCEIVFDILEPTGRITKEIADYLYVGLSTDTGHFMHSNTDSKVLFVAYRLACLGADCHG